MHGAPRHALGRALRCASAWVAPLVMLLALLFAASRPAAAVDSTPPLPTPQLQQRYVALTRELRCMQCQDESLANSEATLAADMRRLVHNLVLEGKTDQQVRDYMVSRYGEFILMKPPFNWANAWLWGAPGALMLIGALVAWRVVSTRSRLVAEDPSEVPDDTELDELEQTPPGETLRS
jgi:cytochrome c-type biogenesis protein CcmH